MNTNDITHDAMSAPLAELDFQELEQLDAPGFWTGFAIGAGIVSTVVASAGLYVGVSALAT